MQLLEVLELSGKLHVSMPSFSLQHVFIFVAGPSILQLEKKRKKALKKS